jgi:hypothetical protein
VRAKVACPIDGDQIVDTGSITIDDEARVYRFACPTCKDVVEKPYSDVVRSILRSANVATIEERVEAFGRLLDDDRNIVRALLD